MSDGNQGSFGSHRFDRWIVQLREDLRQRGVSSAKLYFDDHFSGAKLALTCTMRRGLVELRSTRAPAGVGSASSPSPRTRHSSARCSPAWGSGPRPVTAAMGCPPAEHLFLFIQSPHGSVMPVNDTKTISHSQQGNLSHRRLFSHVGPVFTSNRQEKSPAHCRSCDGSGTPDSRMQSFFDPHQKATHD